MALRHLQIVRKHPHIATRPAARFHQLPLPLRFRLPHPLTTQPHGTNGNSRQPRRDLISENLYKSTDYGVCESKV